MLVPCTDRSMISGMANRPTVTDTRDRPSHRKSAASSPMRGSRVKRGTLSMGSRPMVARTSPKAPVHNPLSMLPPLRDATKVIPRSASMKNSEEPMESTRGCTMGMARARAKAPKTAPTSELMSAAPRARPASPFFAMGWPSTMVAAVMPSPGTPKRIDVISPVVAVTALEPRRNANAVVGSIL